MKNGVVEAALEIVDDQIEVEHDKVAVALAASIVTYLTCDTDSTEAVVAGVDAAIDEIDNETLDTAIEAIEATVSAKVTGEAKRIALKMIRDLAAQTGDEVSQER